MKEVDYSLIPEHMRGGMKMYIEHGIIPGSFLKHILMNDFVHAAVCADEINARYLYSYAHFLYERVPASCWGSEEALKKWNESGGLNGI